MSMPTSAIAATATGLIWSAGFGAGGADLDGVAGEVAQPAGGHLGAAGVVDADEQDTRLLVLVMSWAPRVGTVMSGRSVGIRSGRPASRRAVARRRRRRARRRRRPVVRVQHHDQAEPDEQADDLRDDEAGHRDRGDAGEGVGERAADR